MPAARGFTLVELLVALGIAAALIGLAPVAYERMREGAQYRDTVRTMLSDLRGARHAATTQGRDVVFSVDLQGRRYGADGALRHEIPETLTVRAVVADVEMTPQSVASIRFLPQGGATGGSVDVLRPSGTGVRLRVDWLFGRIEQEVIAP